MKCFNHFAIDFTRTIAGHRTLVLEITEGARNFLGTGLKLNVHETFRRLRDVFLTS